MYKFSFSVRTYNVARTLGFPPIHEWDYIPYDEMTKLCHTAGHLVMEKRKGKKSAMELLRAGGLGVYAISKVVDLPTDTVRLYCEMYDEGLHESLD